MSDYMPIEILAEILVKLPVESLIRFTSVCKSWYSFIKSPCFITKHLNHSKRNTENLLLATYSRNMLIDYKPRYLLSLGEEKFGDEFFQLEPTFSRPVGYTTLMGSCNGLLCMVEGDLLAPCITLLNLAIRKSVTLPPLSKPQTSICTRIWGFGAHPTTHEYMLVFITYGNADEDQGRFPSKVELYTQGTRSWISVTSAGHPHHIVRFSFFKAYVSGAIHWIVSSSKAVDGVRNLIMLFNMASQAFSVMMMPVDLVTQRPSQLFIMSYGGSVAVLCRGEEDGSCCIWVMKEYGVVESWAKLYNFNLPAALKILGFRRNGEVLLSMIDNQLLCYDHETITLTTTGYDESSNLYAADTFMESLILLEGGNGAL